MLGCGTGDKSHLNGLRYSHIKFYYDHSQHFRNEQFGSQSFVSSTHIRRVCHFLSHTQFDILSSRTKYGLTASLISIPSFQHRFFVLNEKEIPDYFQQLQQQYLSITKNIPQAYKMNNSA